MRGQGWGCGSGCWKGTAGDVEDGKGCPGTPAAPVGGGGCEEDGGQGWGCVLSRGPSQQQGAAPWSSPHSKAAPAPGIGVPRELYGNGGGHRPGTSKLSYAPSCSQKKGYKG